jgi:hypothetical protein
MGDPVTYAPDRAEYLANEFSASLADAAELDSGWMDLGQFDKYQCEITGAFGLDLVIDSSGQAGGGRGDDIQSVTALEQDFHLFNVIARQRYVRIRVQNNTGGPEANVGLAVKAFRGASDKLSVFPLSTEPTDFSQAALVQSVGKGQQPDGDYVNIPADGAAFEEFTPLAADGSFESAWFDSDGWNSIDLFVASDVESADQGIEIEFTRDANAGTPVVDATWRRSFKAADVAQGFLEIRLPPILDGFRVRYTNGSTAQSSFALVTTLKVLASNTKFNDAGAQLVGDFLTEVALGNVSNYEMGTKFGRNPDIDAGQTEDVWNGGGDYTGHTLTSPETVDVVSDSTDDDDGGAGARTIRITGLESDTATEYTSEVITMNGTLPVTSTRSWWRVNRVEVLTVGSAGDNQGTITVDPSTTGSSARFAAVPLFNQSTIGAYTVPAGRTMLLKRVRAAITRANGSAGSATMTLRVRAPGADQAYRSIRVFELQTGAPTEFTQLGGDVIEAGSDIKFRVEQVSDGNTIAEAAMEFVLLDR